MEQLPMHGLFLQDGAMAAAVIGSIIAVFALGFLGAPLIVWTIAVAAILWGFAAPVWLVAAVVAVMAIFAITPIRRALISPIV